MTTADQQLLENMRTGLRRSDYIELKKQFKRSQNKPQQQSKTLADIESAHQRFKQRNQNRPKATLAPDLPVSEQADVILKAISNNQVTIIAGETGSGKTTQIPKICLQAGLAKFGQIGCTQPRRIAAKSVAARVAEELQVNLGKEVGYQVRFDEKYDADGYIRFMTDGILLQQTLNDRWLNQYDTIIIDEAHERSLNIDFLLGFIQKLLVKRDDLKVIITSATIDTEKFSQHFNEAPIINVSGRSYPVSTHYRAIEEQGIETTEGIVRAVDEIYKKHKTGDVLVFLPGEREINEAADRLRKKHLAHTEILPLYARLPAAQQMAIFKPGDKRRIIISTNVAETSLTVPRVHFVIDSGTARISRYSARSKIQGLQVEAIAQDSANQRQGRCGRIAAGHCYRLYSEADFESRPEHTDAEIMRTSLASVILQTRVLSLGDLEDFPFIDSPEFKQVADGYQLLQELQALDEGRQLTKVGRMMAYLPIDVQLSRILIAADKLGCLREILIMVSLLSVQDPRERPLDWAKAADKAHEAYADEDSDFSSLLHLWNGLDEKRKKLKNKGFRDWCRKNFISIKKYMEWKDVHRQLSSLVKQQKMQINSGSSSTDSQHRALLSGFISHVGMHYSDQTYLGTRQKKFMIFPGSGLFNRHPKWLVAGEIVHTSQVFARMVAQITVAQIIEAGQHLIKESYFDPFWSKKQGTVMGYQRITLIGLTLEEKKKTHFGPHDPETARSLFIEQGLVGRQLNTRLPFYHHNVKTMAAIEAEEDRHRKKDLLLEPSEIVAMYEAVIPAGIYSEPQLKRWVHKNGDETLRFTADDFYRQQAQTPQAEQFPAQITIRQLTIPLSYTFAPEQADDGVTAQLDLPWLNALNANDFEFLVPGLLHEKVVTLIKGLPKSLRRGLIPVNNYADIIVDALDSDQEFYQQLVAIVAQKNGLRTVISDWQSVDLPAHLQFRFEVFDDQKKLLYAGRDFNAILSQGSGEANRSFQKSAAKNKQINGATDWVFGELSAMIVLENGLAAFPAVTDQETAVGLRYFETEAQAAEAQLQGIKRLIRLKYPKIVKSCEKLKIDMKAGLAWEHLGAAKGMLETLIDARIEQHIAVAEFIDSQTAFDALAEDLKSALYADVHAWIQLLNPLIKQWYELWQNIENRAEQLSEPSYADMIQQLDDLIYDGFLKIVEAVDLNNYSRYLKALEMRLEAALHSPQKEAEKLHQVQHINQPFQDLCEQVEVFSEQHQAFLMLLQEYRVSLFAQSLGTQQKVSAKRLKNAFKQLQTQS